MGDTRLWKGESDFAITVVYGFLSPALTSFKTILTSYVIETLRASYSKPNAGICYHYCDYTDVRTLNVSNLFNTMTRQLLETYGISDVMKSELKKYIASQRPPSCQQIALDLFISATKAFSDLFIILDGFDELSGDNRTTMLKSLHPLMSEIRGLKLFISCRQGDLSLEKKFHRAHQLEVTEERVKPV